MFDSNGSSDDENVREIHFPLSFDTVLAEAVNSLSTVDSSPRNDDFAYLDALGFTPSQRMFAVPLTARGRGVAVLYADAGGGDGSNVNLEALESLVRVAALTVELRAASQQAVQPTVVEAAPSYTPMPAEEVQPVGFGYIARRLVGHQCQHILLIAPGNHGSTHIGCWQHNTTGL